MKIKLSQKDKKRLVSLALAGTLTTGLPVLANAENDTERVTAPLVGETQVDYTEYVVKDGDTLGSISERLFGNAGYWEQIAEYNKLKEPNKLFVGDVIKIPNRLNAINCNVTVLEPEEVTPVEPVDCSEDETYVVQDGDIMSCIIKKFYDRIDLVTVDKLATYNNLDDPNMIYVGQELLIPCIEKLDNIVPNDYTEKYAELQWRLDHPECNYVWNDCNQEIIWIWNECYQPLPPCPPKDMPEPHCHHRRILKP